MSFFDRIFGNKKSKPLKHLVQIEQTLQVKFPDRFHEMCQSNAEKEILLELCDEHYSILKSIVSDHENVDTYEQVIYLSREMNDRSKLINGKVKIPFARNLSGDQHKYLFFEGVVGEQCGEQIFTTDLDSNIGQLEISKLTKLFSGKMKSQHEQQIVLDCKPQTIEALFTDFQLPATINYWQNSLGSSSRANSENAPIGYTVEQHAINYEFEDPNERIAKFEIQSTFTTADHLFFTSSAYEIDNAQLKGSIQYNVDYRIFYYKFYCIVDALLKSKDLAVEEEIMTENEFLASVLMKPCTV